MSTIYMDNAATTSVRDEVLCAMLPYFTKEYGNPSGIYGLGRSARKAVEAARREVAEALGAMPQEIYFTSGGSESDNWAITCAPKRSPRGRHIITSMIEHHAVLNSCLSMEKQGYEVTYIKPDDTGLIDPDAIRRAIRPDTALISIIAASNEIGTVQPVREIGSVAKEYGVPFHTDAVQAIGAIPVNVDDWQADMLSVSAHKFHGPKGVGALYIRKGTLIESLMHGGAQERGLRAGTENVPAIVGMGKAITLAAGEQPTYYESVSALRDELISGILGSVKGSRLNGHQTKRLPGNVNISIAGVDGEALLIRLDFAGIAVSSGSACTSASPEPSHVLLAIGLNEADARSSVRLTLGRDNTRGEVERVVDELAKIVKSMRDMTSLTE